jgi:hypothetical protein
VSVDEAPEIARLQGEAMAVRAMARESDPGYFQLSVSQDHHELVYKSADYDAAVQFARTHLESVPVHVIEVPRSESDWRLEFEETVRLMEGGTTPLADSAVGWVRKDPTAVVIEVSATDLELILSKIQREDAVLAERVSNGTLVISPLPAPPSEGATLRGGHGATLCTWGFKMLEIDGGTRRMITAGHCGNTQSYAGIPLGYKAGSERNSGNVDAQLHSVPSGHATAAEIYDNDAGTSTRPITSRGTWSGMDVDDPLCHRGRTTKWSCGRITAVHGSQAVGGGSNVLRARGPTLEAQPGDSGGPIVFGYKALGLYEGQYGQEPPDAHMIWTAINYAESLYDAYVAMQ